MNPTNANGRQNIGKKLPVKIDIITPDITKEIPPPVGLGTLCELL
tara:strand:+ start:312 stop:446 length:135 start_codon:yes stop_codon:yes gene_type:complete